MKSDYIFLTSRKNKVTITAYGVRNVEDRPCLILVHGFKGFKDWGFFPPTAEYFAKHGYFVVSFNFSHNGVSEEKPEEFVERALFEQNTFSLEVEELSELVDLYRDGFFGDPFDEKIFLLGHSRGGAEAILAASRKDAISAVGAGAPAATLDRYTEAQKKRWRENGVFEVLNARTKQVMRLGTGLLDDLEENGDALDVVQAVRELDKPLFIAHGEQDLAVPIREGETLYEAADKKKTVFKRFPSTGHTFHISHPYEGSNPTFDELLESTRAFFDAQSE